jgi:glycosyltransferase involved in cell wall biosynthesis
VTASVSVIVPCYNYGHYLEDCVQSVLTQQEVELEVLVIDDCSTDSSAVVAAGLAADSRVSFRQHQTNLGHIATYNEGLAWASGDYTVLLSADDMLTPGSLRRAARALDAAPMAGLAYGRVLRFDQSVPRSTAAKVRPVVWDGSDWIGERCKTATCNISSPEAVVRTTLYKELGGYEPNLPHAGDLEMWLRIAAHGEVVYLRGADQAFYRMHPSSMSRTRFKASIDDLKERKASFDSLFDRYGARVKNAPLMREQAQRALAREALWRACRAFDRRRLDSVSVEELELFALETYRDTTSLREYRGLGLRRRLGPKWCPRAQFGMPSVYIHRARDWLWWRRLYATGV